MGTGAKLGKIKSVTLHTLRHSFATTANTLGFGEPTIGAMLGHSRGTVPSRYVHMADEALLAAADRVAGAIARDMAGEKPAKVHKIGDRRRAWHRCQIRASPPLRYPLST